MSDDELDQKPKQKSASWQEIHSWAGQLADHVAIAGKGAADANLYGTLTEHKVEAARLSSMDDTPALAALRADITDAVGRAMKAHKIDPAQPISALRQHQFETSRTAWQQLPTHESAPPPSNDSWRTLSDQIKQTLSSDALRAANRSAHNAPHLQNLADAGAVAEMRSLNSGSMPAPDPRIQGMRAYAEINSSALGVTLAPANQRVPPTWSELAARAATLSDIAVHSRQLDSKGQDHVMSLGVIKSQAERGSSSLDHPNPAAREQTELRLASIAKDLRIAPTEYIRSEALRAAREAEIDNRALAAEQTQARAATTRHSLVADYALPQERDAPSSYVYQTLTDHHRDVKRYTLPGRPAAQMESDISHSPSPAGTQTTSRSRAAREAGSESVTAHPERRRDDSDGRRASPADRAPPREMSDRALARSNIRTANPNAIERSDARQRDRDDGGHDRGGNGGGRGRSR